MIIGKFDFGGIKNNMQENVEAVRYSGSAMMGASKSFEGSAGTELEV